MTTGYPCCEHCHCLGYKEGNCVHDRPHKQPCSQCGIDVALKEARQQVRDSIADEAERHGVKVLADQIRSGVYG